MFFESELVPMPTVTLCISSAAHETLKQLSLSAGEPIAVILDRAVEHCRRMRFLEGLNEDFERLRGDSKHWREELRERAARDATLADRPDD